MIRMEIQKFDANEDVSHIEFKTFGDWDTLIGYIWQKYTVDNMWPTTEEDIRLRATRDSTGERVLMIIEQVM